MFEWGDLPFDFASERSKQHGDGAVAWCTMYFRLTTYSAIVGTTSAERRCVMLFARRCAWSGNADRERAAELLRRKLRDTGDVLDFDPDVFAAGAGVSLLPDYVSMFDEDETFEHLRR